MIVQPDFPEHWKTRLLVKITGDKSAPLAVIRLWAHCQHSKRHELQGAWDESCHAAWPALLFCDASASERAF